jgi:glycosyltransferase involved in cell wall biosynthesis/SAM-dependent methyltransferase
MRQPRILTFNFHEPYLCLLAKTGLAMDVGVYEHGHLARPWQTHFRAVPPGLTLRAEAEWRAQAAAGAYDVIITQNEMNAIDLLRAPAQKLLIQHNRRSFLNTTVTIPQGDAREAYAQLLERLQQAYTFIYISESKRADCGIPGLVIPPGIDLDEYHGYTGEVARVLRVGNTLQERNLMFDVPFQERVCVGLPNQVLGENPGMPGSAPAADHAALMQHYRSLRCMLHVTREAYEDGYNLAMLEAMATGMPIVSLGNTTSPITDGVDGFVSYDAAVLRERLETLLADRDLAQAIGARGRQTVAEKFPLDAFTTRWRDAIFNAAERTAYAQGQSRVAVPPPSFLVHHISSPTTTAGYLTRALARQATVCTAGFRVPEDVLQRWGFEDPPPPYPPQQIPLGLSAAYRELLASLPQGFHADYYLWIDSGPKQVEADIGALPWPKVAYLIDTHIAPDLRLAMAWHFDAVFLAQQGQVEAFRQAGISNVQWLPLACDPALHAVGPFERTIDVAYIGTLDPEEQSRRRALLDQIAARFPNHRIGKAWPTDMAEIYARSKIVVNFAVERDVNMRVFEGMAAGALLITSEADGLESLFTDGEDLVIFRRDEDVFACIERYLADDEARTRIAAAGQARVLAEHTYDHRMRSMLETLEAVLPRMHGEERPPDKPLSYYQNAREEVLAQIPLHARRVLDVGCGAGVLGRTLKEQRGAEFVAGIEVVEEVAREARRVLDAVIVGNLEVLKLPFEKGFFDCIVCADVLEHLVEPELALRKLSEVLAPDGLVVISIPNVQFSDVVSMLVEGQFTYMDAGITDATHMRFFTRSAVERLVRDAGLEPCLIAPLSMLRKFLLKRSPEGTVKFQGVEIQQVSDAEYEDLRTYQFLALAGHPGADRLSRARLALEHSEFEAAVHLADNAVGVDEAERGRIAGKALARLGRLDEAEARLRLAFDHAKGASVAEDLGILLVGMQRGAEARPYLEFALANTPHAPRAQGAYGLLLETEGDYAGACSHLKLALEAGFDHHALIPHFVACAAWLGCLEEAEPIVRGYAEFYPGNLDLACCHADILLSLNRAGEARDRLELPRMLAPDHERVRLLWTRLESNDAHGG